jgi:hypothetical protein
MELTFSGHLSCFNRIFSVRFDVSDITFGVTKSKSGATVVLSVGPLHLAYSDIKKMTEFLSATLDEEYSQYLEDNPNDIESLADEVLDDNGNRVLH